jgi:hypothetical protein
MEFGRFESRFLSDAEPTTSTLSAEVGIVQQDLRTFWNRYAERSFNQGLYRIFGPKQITPSRELIDLAFPDYKTRAICFSYDWLGRLFAIDLARSVEQRHGIIMLEPGTSQVLEIAANLESFHNDELISYTNEALASEFYQAWRTAGGVAPAHEECIGYKKPLFLGGKDDIQNLELIDLDVYWHISAQIIKQTRGIPSGTQIRHSEIEP